MSRLIEHIEVFKKLVSNNLPSIKLVVVIAFSMLLIASVIYRHHIFSIFNNGSAISEQAVVLSVEGENEKSIEPESTIDKSLPTPIMSLAPPPTTLPSATPKISPVSMLTQTPTLYAIPTSSYSSSPHPSIATSTPSSTPSPTSYPNYVYDNDYPILLKMEGFGETFYNSHGNGVFGPYFLNKIYAPGDTLTIKAVAYDPKGRNINYTIELNTPNHKYYSNQAAITLTETDIKDSVGLTVKIIVDTPYHRFGDADDYMQFLFKVRP